MPLRSPQDYADRQIEWFGTFAARRLEDIREQLTPELFAEYAADSDQRHSELRPELRRVINYFLALPSSMKVFVYSERPYDTFRLGRIDEAGALQAADDREFPTKREAAVAAMLLRMAGVGIDTEALTR